MTGLDPLRPLASLKMLGFTLRLDAGYQLKVKPRSCIDATVDAFIAANKRLIKMELAGLLVPCRKCARELTMAYEPKVLTSEDAGMWFSISCACGHDAYICERDLVLRDDVAKEGIKDARAVPPQAGP